MGARPAALRRSTAATRLTTINSSLSIISRAFESQSAASATTLALHTGAGDCEAGDGGYCAGRRPTTVGRSPPDYSRLGLSGAGFAALLRPRPHNGAQRAAPVNKD